LVLSMEDPSTIRSAVADIGRAPYGGDSLAGQTGDGVFGESAAGEEPCTSFVLCSQYVLFILAGTGLFRPSLAWLGVNSGLI